MTSVLFLCTGNSCRSQIAEGWLRYFVNRKGAICDVQSAGIVAHGLNPNAVKVMAEVMIDIAGQQSKTLDEIDLGRYQLVVTVCGEANEQCPVLGEKVKKIHWPLADPAMINGTPDEILQGFRLTREEIRALVSDLVNTFF